MIKEISYENLVLEGGGFHGVAYVGCLRAMEKEGLRDGLKRFGGASIGALVAFAAACRVPAKTMLADVMRLQEQHITGGAGYARAFYNFCSQYGFYDLQRYLTPWLEDLFQRYCDDPHITFGQLKEKFGTDLFVAVFNRTRCRSEIKHQSDSRILPTIVASMAFPGFFMPVHLPGSRDLYLDGGATNNFPIYLFDQGGVNMKTLGIRTVPEKSSFFSEEIGTSPPPITGLVDYYTGLLSTLVTSAQQRYEKPTDAARTCFVKIPDRYSAMEFDASDHDKGKLYRIGYRAFLGYLNRLSGVYS